MTHAYDRHIFLRKGYFQKSPKIFLGSKTDLFSQKFSINLRNSYEYGTRSKFWIFLKYGEIQLGLYISLYLFSVFSR